MTFRVKYVNERGPVNRDYSDSRYRIPKFVGIFHERESLSTPRTVFKRTSINLHRC